MSTNFPTSLDTFPAAATLATQTLFTTPHSTLHGNLGDSLAAVEAKVGIDASAVTTSLDYNVKNLKPGLSNGRLTLTTGVPVTTADVTGATTVYFTPYNGNGISLYSTSATKWFSYTFAEISASLAGLTLSVPTDVFAYWTGSAVALELVNWTNGTTRATALALQDGVNTKSGDATRLYLGTVCGSGTGTCEDSFARRLVCNAFNRVVRLLKVVEATASWVYTVAAWRMMNNSSANRVSYCSGTGDTPVQIVQVGISSSDTAGVTRYNGPSIDSATTPSYDFIGGTSVQSQSFGTSFFNIIPAVGYHYFQAMEFSVATGTTTWYGGSGAGIIGSCFG